MDGVESVEHYSGSGTYFGSGTNVGSRTSTLEIVRRVRILKYLSKYKGRKLNAIALNHIEKVKSGNTYKVTSDGWEYWKDVEEANKELL